MTFLFVLMKIVMLMVLAVIALGSVNGDSDDGGGLVIYSNGYEDTDGIGGVVAIGGIGD